LTKNTINKRKSLLYR